MTWLEPVPEAEGEDQSWLARQRAIDSILKKSIKNKPLAFELAQEIKEEP